MLYVYTWIKFSNKVGYKIFVFGINSLNHTNIQLFHQFWWKFMKRFIRSGSLSEKSLCLWKHSGLFIRFNVLYQVPWLFPVLCLPIPDDVNKCGNSAPRSCCWGLCLDSGDRGHEMNLMSKSHSPYFCPLFDNQLEYLLKQT